MSIDIIVYNHGSVLGFHCDTPAAVDWWNEHVNPGMEFGGSKIVEPRYAPAIIDGAVAAGLLVEVRP